MPDIAIMETGTGVPATMWMLMAMAFVIMPVNTVRTMLPQLVTRRDGPLTAVIEAIAEGKYLTS